MKICVLQPDWTHSTDSFAGQRLVDITQWLPNAEVDTVTLDKATIYRQLQHLKKQEYDIFVNLCRGFQAWDVAAYVDVTRALEDLNLPYTGPARSLYDAPKPLMKTIAFFAGVETPGFVVAETLDEAASAANELMWPLFVKPLSMADGLGIHARSHIATHTELMDQTSALIQQFNTAFIEEFIDGREFTVLVVGNPVDSCNPVIYPPVEAIFSSNPSFKQIETQTHYTACKDGELNGQLQDAAKRLFVEMNQGGYACFDFRLNAEGELMLIDINAPCAVFCTDMESPADMILHMDSAGHAGFLRQIIADGMHRHRDRQKKYQMKKSPIATYGIFATQAFRAGDVVVKREATLQNIATLSHVRSHWTTTQKEAFLRYTYLLKENVLVLRDPNPNEWLVQNHSCDPNTAYCGFDLVATRDITQGEELTVDFATFRDQNRLEFDCLCGAPNCRGAVRLVPCDEAPIPPVNLSSTLLTV
ncbi:SET domain-containing protein-lysine N-methyltransferase [Leptolyngbya sp. AN02str]|uniref:SET domain-containing protein-lysine N-methyltransferase n=1 Tax=Leptolyngbya sp. AN02str TaxID=3423363 RepID=UPI003D310D62